MVSTLITTQLASDTMKRHNEDVIGKSDAHQFYWVIDGASSLDNLGASDEVSDFAQLLSLSLTDAAGSFRSDPLLKVAETAHLSTIRKWDRSTTPTASLALASVVDNRLHFLLLGDCSILTDASSDPAHIIDPQFDGSEERTVARVQRLLKMGDSPNIAYNKIGEFLRTERARRNQVDGKWIIGNHPEAVQHAYTGELLLEPGKITRVALMSDGYRRAYDLYKIYPTPIKFLDAVARSPVEPIAKLRTLEDLDPLRTKFPRLSVSDDASVLYLEITPPQ